MVDVVADRVAVKGFRGSAQREVGFISTPDNSAFLIRHPPHAHKLMRCPQTRRPFIQHASERIPLLAPSDLERGRRLEGDLDDDPKRSERYQPRAEQVWVVCRAAADELTIGEDQAERVDAF